ncbi:TELO2-interacting protein 1 homolog [Babylonia areolata]|uniref:TELO2-interacting protein 1 homolog n=1 Tax=Babylonia areolata TaxID=304850 RepID=UPI003FD2CAE8
MEHNPKMMESGAVRAALQHVKPVCMELVQSPSTSTVQALARQLKGLDQEVMQQMQQFLIFPLRTTLVACLSKSLPQQLLIETCHAVGIVLKSSKLQHVAVFMDLFSLLSDIMLSSSGELVKRDLSEEEKVAAIQILCCLLNNCHLQVLHQLYVPTSIARLGSVVSQLVAVVSDVRASRRLRAQAMQALLVLLQKRTYDHEDSWWQHGNRFAGLLPGISTAMLKVLLGDSKQGHQLFCRALEVWTEVVCLTLGDQSLAQEQREGHAWVAGLKMDGRLKELMVCREERWVETVVPRVEFMVKEVSKLKKHDHWKVRLQLVSWAHRLLSDCTRAVQSCTSPLLEVLVLLMTDEYSQVAAPAAAALEEFRTNQSGGDGSLKLLMILKEDLFALLTSLPRRIRMEDEEEKRAVVGLLISYISLLGPDMSSLLLSHTHVTRLTRVLVQVLAMDVSDQKILEESGMGARGLTNLSQFVQQASVMTPRKVFLHFRDDKVKSDLFRVCRLLGKFGDVRVMVESVMEVYRESSTHHLPCVLILNHILSGHADRGDNTSEQGAPEGENSLEEIVRLLLEEYLSTSNMSLCDTTHKSLQPSSWSASSPSSLSLFVMKDDNEPEVGMMSSHNRSIMLTCLFMEGVAVCAQVLGRRFRLQLTEALYPVTEKVGSEISAVSGTAYLALAHIASACCYQSVDELLQSNADYIVTSISLRLWHFERHPRAPSVLSVMLQLCATDILPLVWDSVLQIMDTLDQHHTDQAVAFLPVLHHLTLAVARWFPPQNTPQGSPPAQKSGRGLNPQELVHFLLERRRLQLEAENFEADPEPEDPDNIQDYIAKMDEEKRKAVEEEGKGREEDGEEETKEPPLHVKAVKEVLLRAKHIVSSSDPRLTLLALDIIGQGCVDLADFENELLPIVHQVWASFKKRFHDTEKVVVIKAVKTLQRLCECCGDFIRQRVEKDVLPSLRQFLHSQARTSAGRRGSYQYTVNYKLQLTLLTTLGPMALQMGLDGLALEAVLQCCLLYLSERQPATLQQACVESVKQMVACNGDVVWLALCNLYTPTLPSPPSSHCKPVTVFKNVGEHNEYATNVTQLLRHLDSLYETDTSS